MAEADYKWYYDPENHTVSQGKTGSWSNRMGPYDTKEDAENALALVKQRNAEADAQDEEDEDWGEN